MNVDTRLSQKISIVLIERNRASELATNLERLHSLYEPVPIIVVDNGSEDETVPLIRATYPHVELLQLFGNYGSAGRNIGARYARTPYIAFADDDSWWKAHALETAIAYFEQYPELGLIQGKILLPGGVREPACQFMDSSPLATPAGFPGRYILGFIACGAVVRKDAFLAAGGFHQRFGVGGEEELVALDMAENGWKLAYFPDVVAYHAPSAIRDKTRRRQLTVRNHLWSVWLRYSVSSIFAETSPLLLRAMLDGAVRKGVCEAVHGIPWILKERRPLSPALEQDVRKLTRFHP